MRRSAGLVGKVFGEVKGRLLALDVQGAQCFCCVAVYAPNTPKEIISFFQNLYQFVRDNTILMGDFNSVTHAEDRLSGNLVATSNCLQTVLQALNLSEIQRFSLGCFLFFQNFFSFFQKF